MCDYSHLIIDGVEVHVDSEAYLVQNLGRIREIEIIPIPAKEFVNDLLLSAEDYLTRALPQVEHFSVAFTEEAEATQWTDLNDLFKGIQWLTSMLQQ